MQHDDDRGTPGGPTGPTDGAVAGGTSAESPVGGIDRRVAEQQRHDAGAEGRA